MIAELKPCPFCRAQLEEQAPGYFVHPASTECVLSMQEYDFDGAPYLAELWNRRAQEEEKTQSAVPRVIGWRTEDYLYETDDLAMARNWEPNVRVLPIFEGDPNTRLGDQKNSTVSKNMEKNNEQHD